MKKPIPKRKKIIIIVAALLAVLAVIGLIFGLRSAVDKNIENEYGAKKATAETLKILKEEADKVENASKVFFTLEDYKKYEYPTGKVITVEVNDYGKLVVLGNKFETEALNDLIAYSGVNVGADIGITDVVYAIRFDEGNVIEASEGDAQNPDTILKEVTESPTTESTVKPVNGTSFQGYADKVLELLKSYVAKNNLTLKNGEILVYTDDDGYLKMLFMALGINEDQLAEFTEIVRNAIPLDEFVGLGTYGFKINANNGVYSIEKYNQGV